ncbi:hypothetical protein [uncultured Thiothrix sp.]|uniref:hypothetical protein n=1 Tax=uncultured Thiothrix sp. TaxID=223185 RepID=UPI0026296E8E|nr:hypothetical protein [uncultured Thiothrix sp.]
MRILKLPKEWQSWYFWEYYLVDPDGNRYSVEMVRSSLFTLQLSHELRGSTLQIHSLKQELKQRIENLKQFQEITVTWGKSSH